MIADSSNSTTWRFTKRWHWLALAVFVVSWSLMLIPMLLWPAWPAARVFTLGCLTVGVSSILALLVSGITNHFHKGLEAKPHASRRL